MAKRKTLSKKTRFEVFKRDSFTCQYCGKQAPDVVLEIDHINPVSKGGNNDLTNLVTTCFDCNRGKTDKKISDDAVVKKQMNELEKLNVRREQIEMVFEWKQELLSQDNEIIDKIVNLIDDEYTPRGNKINENGRDSIKKSYKKYGFNTLLEAINKSFEQYDDFETAFNKIDKIAYYIEHPMPEKVRQSFYLRGILKNRLNHINDQYALELLQKDLEIRSYEFMKEYCLKVSNWTQFKRESSGSIEEELEENENS